MSLKKKAFKKVVREGICNVPIVEKVEEIETGCYTVIWTDGDEIQISHCPTELVLENFLEDLTETFGIKEEDPDEYELNSKVVVIRGDVEGLRISSYKKYNVG